MQRDKKGRFVKKAKKGIDLNQTTIFNTTSYDPLNFGLNIATMNANIEALGQTKPDLFARNKHVETLNTTKKFNTLLTPKIKYHRTADGKYIDQYGKELNIVELGQNPHLYEEDLNLSKSALETETDSSAGMNFSNSSNLQNQQNKFTFDKTKIANFLELARAGIGASVNNKIADRALKAEKPFLQETSEIYRPIYGNYRALVEGEKNAAALRNTAAQPITSDGALQSQMRLEAETKAQDYINQGNTQDEALIKQTREAALLQNKENLQQRQAAAMQNKQAMLMSEKNKSTILNSRDSNNFSNIVSPLLSATELRLRNEGAEQDYYKDYYNNAIIEQNVWNSYRDGLTDSQKLLVDEYLRGGYNGVVSFIGEDTAKEHDWIQVQQIMNQEIMRQQAAQRGASLNITPKQTDPYAMWAGSNFKKGGTIYKAKLTKRTRDNDRGAKSIETSKKIAARFLEKAIDSLYTYNDVELIAKPKNKRRKYLAGGGLPFVGFTPVFATSEKGVPQTQKTEKTDDSLTSKDILELLKDMDGLPSDMKIIVSALQNFTLQDQMDPLGLSSSNVASRYISLINKIKVAKFNKDEYDAAFNQLKGNGGLTELAITSEGMLIGTNEEGDFQYFTPEEVSKNEHTNSGYQLLTNSNLLHIRANSLDAAFNHKLTTVAQNGIGIETVNTLINDVIKNLGTSTDSQEGYVKTSQGKLIKGLEDFYKAVLSSDGQFDGTINDLYKYKYLTKSQADLAKQAMAYIYNTLPANARTLLKVKSDGTEQGALKLIETMISSTLSPEQQFDIDLVGGRTHKKSGSGTSKDDDDLKTSLPLNVQKGIGGVDTYINIDRGDGIHMSVRGTQFNFIKTPGGDPITDTSLLNMLHESGLQSIIKDIRGIQFGDQIISPEALASITYNNTGVMRTNLPIKPDGTVNLDLLEAYEKAEAELDLLPNKSPEKVKEIYEKYKLTSLLNADGTYNQSKFAPFMVTEGYTTDALSGIKNSEFVKEYKGDEDAAIALIQRSLATGSGKDKQVPNIDSFSWYNPADWFNWTDTIYKGVIYIPLSNNVNSAVLGANLTLDYDEALIQEEKYQNFEKMSNQRSTDASVLNI